MPWHFQPLLRAREEAFELEGLIKTLDSVGITRRKAEETAVSKTKLVPKIVIKIRKNSYTPS